MLEAIVIGIIQGITEWLPISSSGFIAVIKKWFFDSQQNFAALSQEILFLHLGTFCAAFIYFHKDIWRILRNTFTSKKKTADHKTFIFLMTSTIISGGLGWSLIKGISHIETMSSTAGQAVMFLIGLCLIGTGILQIKTPSTTGLRKEKDLTFIDAILLGLAQGLAALPGFSRSGLTLSALMLRKFQKETTLKLSFLMSLPIVLLGNIVTNASDWHWSTDHALALSLAFLFGLLTIHGLLKMAQRVNFGKFVLFFGMLTIIAAFF